MSRNSAVVLHHPEDVDTASCFALLQEVELESYKIQVSLKHSPHSSSRHIAYADKAKAPTISNDFRKMSKKRRAMRA